MQDRPGSGSIAGADSQLAFLFCNYEGPLEGFSQSDVYSIRYSSYPRPYAIVSYERPILNERTRLTRLSE